MREDNAAYGMTASLEITHLLRSVQASRSLLLVQPPNRSFNAVTMVLHVDPKAGVLILDGLRDEEETRKLLLGRKILCETSVDQISLWFEAEGIRELQYADQPALQVRFPEAVSYIQRRNNFRVDVPMSLNIACSMDEAGLEDQQFRVMDLSSTGMALSDDACLLDATAGKVYSGVIDLGEIGSFPIKARVVHCFDTSVRRGGNERRNRRLGMVFEDMPGRVAIRIQSLVDRLQRDIIARERGLSI